MGKKKSQWQAADFLPFLVRAAKEQQSDFEKFLTDDLRDFISTRFGMLLERVFRRKEVKSCRENIARPHKKRSRAQ